MAAAADLPHCPQTGSLGLGTRAHPCPLHFLCPGFPDRVKNGFTSNKMCFLPGQFSIYSQPSSGGAVLPLSRFFSGYLGINSWWLFLSLVVSSPAGHSFRMSPESPWFLLQEFMLISVASETSYLTWPAWPSLTDSSWCDDEDDNYS